MADTFSLRFEIDASRAEAGAKKFVSAIASVNKSLDAMDAKAKAAFDKLMAGGSSGGDFTKLAKDLGRLNSVNINPAAVKSINSIGTAFKNLKAPSQASIKNITSFANTIPGLLNSFNVSGNFADSLNKISSAMGGFKVPSQGKVDALKSFGTAIQQIAPSLRIAGNFAGIAKLGEVLGGFKAPSEKAVSNMRAFFNALNNSAAKASISGGLVNGIVNLSGAMAGMKSPSAGSVKNLRDMFAALATFKPVGGTGSISQITQAFANFKGPTAAQTKNLREFVTMLGTLKVPANAAQIAHYLELIGAAATRANASMHNFRNTLGGLGGAGGGFNSSAASMTTNLRGLENAFSGTFQAASVFRTMIGSITLGTLSKSIYDANTAFQAFKSTMSAATGGDIQKTGEEMRYTEDMANRLGQRIQDIQESYASFSISANLAGVSQDQTRKIFEATVTAMTVLHRSSDRTKLALLALEQMMSKGTISSEELRRQLGEQLPGSVNLMARALGVGTDELQNMLKAGSVLSADALPKFAEEIQRTFGGSLEAALNNAVSQFNLLYNAVYSLQIVMGQSGAMQALAGAFEKVKDAISAPEFVTFSSQFGERTAKVITVLGDSFAYLVKNIDTVVFALKLLLAYKIGGFIQALLGGFVSLRGALVAGAAGLTAFRAALAGTVPLAVAARTAIVGLSAGSIALTALSGPLGAVIFGLGVLATAWFTSGEKAEEFNTVVDQSKASLDRYKDSVAEYSTMQIVNEQQKVKQAMLDSQQVAAKAAAEVQKLSASNGRGAGGGSEFTGVLKQFREVEKVVKATGGSYADFARQLAETHFATAEAQNFAKAIIGMAGAQDQSSRTTEYGNQKLQILDGTFKSMNSANAVTQMNNVASAASGMAEAVVSAANKVVEANAAMNLSNAQQTMSKEFVDIYKQNKEALASIDSSENSISDKLMLRTDQNLAYKKSYDAITAYANELAGIHKKMEGQKGAQEIIEKMGDAASAAQQKIADARKELEKFNKNSEGMDPNRRANAQAQLQEKIKEAEEAAKPKVTTGGGGGVTKNYDSDTKALILYKKEVGDLDKRLKNHTITLDAYNLEMEKIKTKYAGTSVAAEGLVASYEKLNAELMPMSTASDEFAKKLQILNDAKEAGIVKGDQYTEMLLRLRKAYSDSGSGGSGNSWIDGINKGLTDLTKTSDDFVNDVAGAVTNAFNGLEDALTEWVTTGKMDFKSLASSILSDVARIVIRYTIIQPIIQALSSIMGSMGLGGSIGGSAGGISGGASSGVNIFSAKGNAFNSGKLVPFAKGGLTNGGNSGIVNAPTLFEMSGSKTGMMGEAGPEGILPLKRNSKGELGVSASGSVQAASSNVLVQPKVNVSVINNGGNSEATVQSKQNSDGSLDINVILDQMKAAVAGDISKGGTGLNKAFESRYGANPAVGNKR